MKHDMNNMGMEMTTMGMNMHNNGTGNMTMDHSSMPMGHSVAYFHFTNKAVFLFRQLKTTSDEEMFGACVVLFFIALLYEGLKTGREIMLRNSIENSKFSNNTWLILRCTHIVQTLLHGVQLVVSYCLMLVFMTFNVYPCAAVVLGSMLGYFCFSWKRMSVTDANEHCT